jgi:membrane associated rhomboid family serine protease
MLLIPYNVDVPMQRYPWANWALIAVTSLISLTLLFVASASDADSSALDFWLLCRSPNFHFPGLLTHIFSHADIFHLAGNMLFLFVFGNAVNAKLGHARFIALYLALGLLAGLAWLLCDGGQALLGASGAIMGIVGIFVVLYPRNDVSVYWNIFLVRMGTIQISSFWIVLMYVAFDFWGMIRHHDNVAYISHLTGVAAGAAIASLMVYLNWCDPDPAEENLFQVLGWPTRRDRVAALLQPSPNAPPRTYLVEGLDRLSGLKVRLTLAARSHSELLQLAARKNLVITTATLQR